MITDCPHCGQKVKVNEQGLFRCPHCTGVFRQTEPVTAPAAVETPEQPAPASPEIASSETTPPSTDTPLCERCRRYAATEICSDCNLFVCTACSYRDDKGLAHCNVHRYSLPPANEPAFGEMLRGTILAPAATFLKLVPDGRNIIRAFTFAAIMGTFAVAISLVFEMFLPTALVNPLSAFLDDAFPMLELNQAENAASIAMALLLSPFMIALGVAMNGVMFHLGLMIVGGAKHGITATIKAVAYSNAAAVLSVIPILGPYMFWLYSFVLTIIGAAKLHGISYGRALGGLLILTGALSVLAGIVIAFLALAFGSSGIADGMLM